MSSSSRPAGGFDPQRLIETHQAGVWRYLRALGCDAAQADDLTQDTFLRVLQQPFQDYSPAATAAYLRRAAYHLFISTRRRAGRVVSIDDLDAIDNSWSRLAGEDNGEELLGSLRECLGQLTRARPFGLGNEIPGRAVASGNRRQIVAQRGWREEPPAACERAAPRLLGRQVVMTPDDQHWLDASLEEVLGGRRPPDLAARILESWRAAGGAAEPEAPPVLVPPVAPPRTTGLRTCPVPATSAGLRAEHDSHVVSLPPAPLRSGIAARRSPRVNPALVAAAVLVAGVGIGLVAYVLSGDTGDQRSVAQAGAGGRSKAERGRREASPDRQGSACRHVRCAAARPVAGAEDAALDGCRRRRPARASDATAIAPPFPTDSSDDRAPGAAAGTKEPPLDDQQLVAWMNGQLEKSWREAGVSRRSRRRTPSGVGACSCDCWGAFRRSRKCRRSPPIKRAASASGWSNSSWRATRGTPRNSPRIGPTSGPRCSWDAMRTARPNEASREQLAAYLRAEIAAHRPFDAVAFELIAATGSNQPGADDYNGAVNFLLAHAGDKATQATSRVSRVFLGRNLQCGQCHVDPEGSETLAQQQFWQLNSFFRQMHVERLGGDGGARLVNRDFRGEGRDASDAAVYYELGNGQLRAAFPVFIDGVESPHSGLVSEVDRRRESGASGGAIGRVSSRRWSIGCGPISWVLGS